MTADGMDSWEYAQAPAQTITGWQLHQGFDPGHWPRSGDRIEILGLLPCRDKGCFGSSFASVDNNPDRQSDGYLACPTTWTRLGPPWGYLKYPQDNDWGGSLPRPGMG